MKPPIALAATAVALLVHSHGINLSNYALLLIAIAYAASLVRDFRPIRALRAENIELRNEIKDKDAKMAEKTRQFEILEGSRDFKTAFNESLRALAEARAATSAEHAKQMEVLTALGQGLAANTAALGALAAGINAGTV